MRNITEIIDYRNSETVSKVFQTVKEMREAKKIQEEKELQEKLESMSTHEEMIKEDDEVKHETKKSDKYFFKNILFFTNDRDSESNKTLKNLEKAVKNKGVQIYPFVAEEVDYKATDDKIEWHDNQNKYKVDEQSNVDTIVITRLGVQDSEECMELVH